MSKRDDSKSAGARERIQAAWHEIDQPLVDYLHSRLGTREEAREAAQETYVRLLATPQAVLDIKKYAFAIAKNLATDRLKKRSRHSPFNVQLETELEEHSSPDQPRCDQIERDEIERALQELPTPERDVAKAVLNGETPKEIAARFGMHLRTVYRHIARAEEHFRRKRSAAQPRRTRR